MPFTVNMRLLKVQRLLSICKTLYLFTADDLISIVFPKATCGILLPLASTLVRQPSSLSGVITRAPFVLFWVWINLLHFNICNQSQPGAVLEDLKNKPQRPIPAGRITADEARQYIFLLHLAVIGLSTKLGGLYPSYALHLLTYWYNELGSGETWLLRNLINAGGYLCFITGAMQVAGETQGLDYSGRALGWLVLVAVIISTTMQMQDLYDQEGDKLRDRKTVPLVFGDLQARYSIAIPVALWSIVAPSYWQLPILGFLPSVALGTVLVLRLLDRSKSKAEHDKKTFKIWTVWIISLYMLPLWAHLFEC